MKILLTGANGFIARNLRFFLQESGFANVICFGREHNDAYLEQALAEADFIFHLAGVNRPKDVAEFAEGNLGLTEKILAGLQALKRAVPVVFSSSIQADRDNPYGASKSAAEQRLFDYGRNSGASVAVFRLPNVFGKWSRPFYNSAVATFCHQISRGEAVTVHDSAAPLQLVYIDDVCKKLVSLLTAKSGFASGYHVVAPVYEATVGQLAAQIQAFADSRQSLVSERVGTGLVRALYATYVSFLPCESFAYGVPAYGDQRGVFVEMLKTPDAGQFSFFTAHPGITRGGHYHHTKTEKFLVIRGEARFGFRHIVTGEFFELVTSGAEPKIVETIPGWSHDITNIGQDEMIVMLWANEIFDRQQPDTIAHKV